MTVLGALVVVAAEVATIVDRDGLVEGATVWADPIKAALDMTRAVPAIDVREGVVVDGTVVRSSRCRTLRGC